MIRQAELFVDNNNLYIRDLNSSNGTFVNNVSISNPAGKVGDPHMLKNLDMIEFGVDVPDEDGNQVYKKVVCKLVIVDEAPSSNQLVKDALPTDDDFAKLSDNAKLLTISNLLNVELKEIEESKSALRDLSKGFDASNARNTTNESQLQDSKTDKVNLESKLQEFYDKITKDLNEKHENLTLKLAQDSKELQDLKESFNNLVKVSEKNSSEIANVKNQLQMGKISNFLIFATITSIGGIFLLKQYSKL